MLKMRSATANISDEVESCISYARQYIEEARNGRGYDKVCSAHKALEWLIKAFSISPIATETVIPYIVEALHLLYKGLSEAFGIDIVRSLLEKASKVAVKIR